LSGLNPFFFETFFHIPPIGTQPEKTQKLNPKNRTLHYKLLIDRYTGSLTVPPCTGNAPVFVMDGFAHASRGQIEALRAAFGGNAREVQPAYGRRPREYRAAADAKVPVPLEK
jgi:carbonic anhydrase